MTEDKYSVSEDACFVVPSRSFLEEYQVPGNWISEIVEDPGMTKLNAEIEEFYVNNKETPEEFSNKEAFREALEGMINAFNDLGQLNWSCRVFPTGSTISGLATRNSDVDLCLYMPSAKEHGDRNREVCLRILQGVRHMLYVALNNNSFPFDIKSIEIVDAQIQLLKIFTVTGLEVDLSVCTDPFLSGCHNSYLIRGYCVADDRFAPLSIFIKRWASETHFKDPHPQKGRFNSYAIVMLTIHFLQSAVHPPVLPNLQRLFPEHFAQDTEHFPLALRFDALPKPECVGEKNTMSVGELFLRFLVYYHFFDFDRHLISLRHCNFSHRHDGNYRFRVQIEDPIDEHNPGRTVKDLAGVKRILDTTLDLFRKSLEPEGSFPTAEALLKCCSE